MRRLFATLLVLSLYTCGATVAAQEQPAPEVPLMPPSQAASTDAASPIVVNVDEAGQAYVAGKAVDEDALRTLLTEAVEADPEQPVLLRADRRSPYKHVVAVLNLCSRAGVKQIRVATAQENARRKAGPNVLLILVDDLGYGDLSCYGAPDLKTPNVDKLVARGVKFKQFYANCTVCSPTRASLLSGRYPDCAGVPGVIRTYSQNSWGYLRTDVELLPAVLGRAGYRTAMFGKWHLGLAEPNVPNLRGFDHFHGFLGDMMDDYFHHRRQGQNYMRLNRRTIDPEGHATDLFSEWACRWIEDYRGDGPFFIYLAYNAPHFPIQPPADWLERYRNEHPDVPEKRARNCAFIEHLDHGIGRVLDSLEKSGHAENTLVFFTSDNGGSLPHAQRNLPLSGGKQQHLEGGIRVPACAVWPGRIAPGTTTDRVALSMDLYPTICEAAGIPCKPASGTGDSVPGKPATGNGDSGIDGRSILPTLLGKPQPPEDRYLFWVRLEGGGYQGRPYYAVRRGDWKLLQNRADEPFRLYNLADDPKETTDLAQKHPEIVADLKKALAAHLARCGAVPWRLPDGTGPGELGAANGKWER